jgi:hypothetical protein
MERKYAHSSSLARKFFEDFPDNDSMPMALPIEQQAVFRQYVQPLLDLSEKPTIQECCLTVERLQRAITEASSDLYLAMRQVADYVQSTFALCLVDSAGSRTVNIDQRLFSTALGKVNPEAYAQLLEEDVRRRLVANGLGPLTSPIHSKLDDYPPLKNAILCADAADFLIVNPPPWESYAHIMSSPQAAAGFSGAYAPMAGSVAAARQQLKIPPPGTLLRRATWRRLLQRGSSHYLLSLLGSDEGGSVFLSGGTPNALLLFGQ